jgi:hypothetical protein
MPFLCSGGNDSETRPKLSKNLEEKMKMKILCLGTVIAFAIALCLSATTPAAPKSPATAAVTAVQPTAEPAASPEPHPEIHEALAALRRAKDHMEHAAHDFGGHRVDALKATDEAIRQLEICLKYDR